MGISSPIHKNRFHFKIFHKFAFFGLHWPMPIYSLTLFKFLKTLRNAENVRIFMYVYDRLITQHGHNRQESNNAECFYIRVETNLQWNQEVVGKKSCVEISKGKPRLRHACKKNLRSVVPSRKGVAVSKQRYTNSKHDKTMQTWTRQVFSMRGSTSRHRLALTAKNIDNLQDSFPSRVSPIVQTIVGLESPWNTVSVKSRANQRQDTVPDHFGMDECGVVHVQAHCCSATPCTAYKTQHSLSAILYTRAARFTYQ